VASEVPIAENVAVYEIADPSPLPSRPNLPGTVILRATADEAIDAAAADFLIHAVNCVRSFGDFHLAIAACEGVEPLLRRLMYDPACRDLPWNRAHLWLLDELIDNPRTSPRRAGTLREMVVIPSGIPENQVHEIDPASDAPDSAYEAQIREHLGWREKGHDRLDYVLLGADPSATLAGNPGGRDTPSERLVAEFAESDGARRVTMTPKTVGASRFIGVVALGASSRALLSAATARQSDSLHPDDPRQLLYSSRPPVGGELRWYLDSPACHAQSGASA